jgi:capsular polysaccharide biosynthesis protein/Mrp family chromosome partitioning ATPase
MPDSPRPDSFEVTDYLGVLRRRGWIAIALACLGALVALAYVSVAPKAYMATASVYVTPNAANENIVAGSRTTGSSVNMDNEAQIVQSNTVADVAANALDGSLTPAQLIKQISVTVPANTSVLTIGCAAPTPDGAAACAQSFAQAYLTARHTTAVNKIGSQLSQEQAKVTRLEARTVSLHHQIQSLPANSAALAHANLDLKGVGAQLAALRIDISNLGANTNTAAGYVITAAVPPHAASSPKPLLYLPSGLLAGLLAGLVGAFALDRRDGRIHAARDVERFLDLPVLFSLPQKRISPQTAIVPARSRTGRAYTELAQALATGLGDGNHVLLVAGTSTGPAASVVAANLAATLARTRAEVILVCADLRDAVTATLLGVGDGRGLAEILAGTATVGEVAREVTEVPRLRVITPGVDTTAALNHMQHDASRRLVAGLQRDARYVVIDAQATGEGADTFSLAEFADAALVVLELEKTLQSEASDSIRRLDRMHTAVLGAAVLPNIRPPKAGQPAVARSDVKHSRKSPGWQLGPQPKPQPLSQLQPQMQPQSQPKPQQQAAGPPPAPFGRPGSPAGPAWARPELAEPLSRAAPGRPPPGTEPPPRPVLARPPLGTEPPPRPATGRPPLTGASANGPARGAGETWPLRRSPITASSDPGQSRPRSEDAADKGAGSS